MTRIPDRPNLFVSIHCGPARRHVAELFRRLGWQARKCGWTEFEVTCSFAELVVEAGSPVLVHGAVADVLTNVEQVLAPLRGVGAVYTAECYDNSGGLLWESKSGAAGSNLSPT
jgi:hypothetical protein